MTSQLEALMAQQRQMAQAQQGLLGMQGHNPFLGSSYLPVPGVTPGTSGLAMIPRTLKSDFEEYMRECRREIDLA